MTWMSSSVKNVRKKTDTSHNPFRHCYSPFPSCFEIPAAATRITVIGPAISFWNESQTFRLWASCLFDPISQAKISCCGFVSDPSSSNDNLVLDSDSRNESLALEYLPVLHYIGVLERAADWVFRENKGEEQLSHQRTT